MKTITDEELCVLLENINRNMKKYDDDINVKMEQSDRAELRYMRFKKADTQAHQRVYAKYGSENED
ncbi:MAG: hypothetical protein Q4C77_16245 [Eubacteriales bacterium]|nr:hypothetical protein [Eubacteriales bacterium]